MAVSPSPCSGILPPDRQFAWGAKLLVEVFGLYLVPPTPWNKVVISMVGQLLPELLT